MQDRPNARELLATLSEFLESELLPELEGPLRYRTRVAANLTAILEREQRLGNSYLLRERERLCRVLGYRPEELLPSSLHDQVDELNQELVDRLAEDTVEPGFEERAWQALMETAREKLAIARPGYDAYDAREELP